MPLTNSVIRRYTPPTCTLEVLAQSSPLSRWVGKSVLKELRFELSFDDPQLSEEQRIVIRGDRDQLEALCAAVTNYVQEFLQMSPEKFWVTFLGSNGSNKAFEHPQLQEPLQSSQATQTLNAFNTHISSAEIYIEPSSHLTHNLFLGSLAHPASTSVIPLSLLQLFDLATALDEYSADVLALPSLHKTRSSVRIPAWAPIAAVLVLAVGLMPLTLQYANRNRQQQKTAEKSSVAEEKVALQPSQLDNLSTPTPALTPIDQLPSLPFSSGVSIPGSTLPPAPQTIPTQPAIAPASPKAIVPPTSQPSSENVFTVPPTTAQNLPTSQGKTPPLTFTNPEISLQPNFPKQNSTALTPKVKIAPSENGNLSSRAAESTDSISSSIPKLPPDITAIPYDRSGSTRNQTNLPANSSVTAQPTSKLVDRLRASRNTPTNVSTTTGASGTLFDATKQIAEAREFLRKRWQPPAGLKQTLEYSLLVDVDGSIERIFPLGKAARDYIDRTGMPLIGEPFVSPNKNGQPVKIRAVLGPDGKVQTFAETD